MRRFALLIALCPLLVLGCGDEDEPGRTVTAPANSKLSVLADEYSFDPSAIVLQGAGTPTLPAGRSESARLNLEHGNYRIVCTVGDHEELGMTGTLRVR